MGWIKGNDQRHTGNNSAKSISARHGDFTSHDLDTKGAANITVDFWNRLQNTQSNDLTLYFYNGNTNNKIESLGSNSKNTWLHYTYTMTSSQYYKQNFRIQFKNSNTGFNENVWIDDVRIKTNNTEILNDSFEGDYWAQN